MRTKTSCLWTKSPAWPCIRTTARVWAHAHRPYSGLSLCKGEWRPREAGLTPALCNRIDRNTGGIVIAAKTAEALRILNQKIRDRELDKRYLAVVEGTPRPETGVLKGYLFKDAVKTAFSSEIRRRRAQRPAKRAIERSQSAAACRWWSVS